MFPEGVDPQVLLEWVRSAGKVSTTVEPVESLGPLLVTSKV